MAAGVALLRPRVCGYSVNLISSHNYEIPKIVPYSFQHVVTSAKPGSTKYCSEYIFKS